MAMVKRMREEVTYICDICEEAIHDYSLDRAYKNGETYRFNKNGTTEEGHLCPSCYQIFPNCDGCSASVVDGLLTNLMSHIEGRDVSVCPDCLGGYIEDLEGHLAEKKARLEELEGWR